MLYFIAVILLIVAFIFISIALVGIKRFPGALGKLHALGIIECIAAPIMLVAISLITADLFYASKILLILIPFLLFMSPITTHAIAQRTLKATQNNDNAL